MRSKITVEHQNRAGLNKAGLNLLYFFNIDLPYKYNMETASIEKILR